MRLTFSSVSCLLFAVAICLGLTACSSSKKDDPTSTVASATETISFTANGTNVSYTEGSNGFQKQIFEEYSITGSSDKNISWRLYHDTTTSYDPGIRIAFLDVSNISSRGQGTDFLKANFKTGTYAVLGWGQTATSNMVRIDYTPSKSGGAPVEYSSSLRSQPSNAKLVVTKAEYVRVKDASGQETDVARLTGTFECNVPNGADTLEIRNGQFLLEIN